MLEQACAQLAAWSYDLGHDWLQVAVNVPPLQVVDLELPGQVADAIARHGLSAHQLVVEITEDGLLTDLDAARRVTSELRAAGVSLALDDFGTGYSSLAHLHEIPLTTLKVDRAFVVGLNEDPRVERFMRAVLRLGEDLQLGVVVEGVETSEQADTLRRLGCRMAQGYYFARPAPADAARLVHGPPPDQLARSSAAEGVGQDAAGGEVVGRLVARPGRDVVQEGRPLAVERGEPVDPSAGQAAAPSGTPRSSNWSEPLGPLTTAPTATCAPPVRLPARLATWCCGHCGKVWPSPITNDVPQALAPKTQPRWREAKSSYRWEPVRRCVELGRRDQAQLVADRVVVRHDRRRAERVVVGPSRRRRPAAPSDRADQLGPHRLCGRTRTGRSSSRDQLGVGDGTGVIEVERVVVGARRDRPRPSASA